MHWCGFVELGEGICCWRLDRVDKLGRVGGVVGLGWRKMIFSGRRLGVMDVLLLGLGFSCRVAGAEDVRFHCGRRRDNN